MSIYTPCYYHPTTIIFVDDDPDAVANIIVSLPSHFSSKTFSSPDDALDYINSSAFPQPLHERAQPLVSDINYFDKELENNQRFEECCIVVSDYAMPSMNGIDFFGSLNNRLIHKILLTGIADEKLAVTAFNDQIIDRFFVKQDREVLSKIRSTVESIQWEYFCNASQRTIDIFQFSTPDYLSDHKFKIFFKNLLVEKGICEYYYSSQPSGFVLIDEDANVSRLVIYSKSELEFQKNIAVSKGAPEELVNMLKKSSPDKIPFFFESPYGVYEKEVEDWAACFYDGHLLNANQEYFYAVVDNPSSFITQHQNFLGFYDYLESQE